MDFKKPKITVKELQDCCVSRGIPKSGLKADLIKRLEKYENENLLQPRIINTLTAKDSQLAEISFDTNSICSSQPSDETVTINKGRRPRTIKTWIFKKTYDTHLDFEIDDFWKSFFGY